MPYCEYCEWGAYFSVERANYNQMEINIARIARDTYNKTYVDKLELDSFLDIEIKKPKPTDKELEDKALVLASILKKAGA
jgi:hypothetical protein